MQVWHKDEIYATDIGKAKKFSPENNILHGEKAVLDKLRMAYASSLLSIPMIGIWINLYNCA